MATITQGEAEQIERANAAGRTPVVFIHGLWLLPSSWDRWAGVFEEAGYAPLAPGWPDDPETVEAARANPEVFAGKGVAQVADHFAEVIGGLTKKPAVVGHSFGGLITQILAGRGLSAVSVAVDPAPFRGVLPLPIPALRSTLPVLRNPANRGRAVTLSFEQFRYGWANALGEEEAKRVYEEFHVAAPGKPIFQAAIANLNPGSETRVDSKSPERGPLLIFTGEADHAVPPAMSRAAFKKQSRNEGVTEHVEMPGRGHTLTVDDRWREVADAALAFVKRFA
ncbi:MAG TPA: alpha/beta hydrolase [Solirubrobacterales bacterium]|jgi:pimeloyl-ACP methyl ester carboxylesterase|nr:alpha/beta hydrolase [Solirubrobacterales bacterium]